MLDSGSHLISTPNLLSITHGTGPGTAVKLSRSRIFLTGEFQAVSKICLHIQSLSTVNREMLASSIHLAFYIGRHSDHTLLLSTPMRGSIDRGRNEAAKIALASECDYLWFLDDDMVIAPNTLESLISCQADIAMAHSYIRGYPYLPMSFMWEEGSGPDNLQGSKLRPVRDEELVSETGVVDVAAVGFTCALIRCELLKKLQPPYFLTSPNCTEDVHFCLKAHFEQPDPVWVVVDLRVPTVHLGNPEHICAGTVQGLREYHKRHIPTEHKSADRGEDYLAMVERLIGE
jgi:hypothetical protein